MRSPFSKDALTRHSQPAFTNKNDLWDHVKKSHAVQIPRDARIQAWDTRPETERDGKLELPCKLRRSPLPTHQEGKHACNQQAEKMEPNTFSFGRKNHCLRKKADEFSFGPAKPLWN